MKPSLWFIIPAHGRLEIARMCLEQLRRTCDALDTNGVRASAVIVADDENLDTARELGFGTVRRENAPLGRKWNDGYQAACDPRHNPHPVDYVIPFGSDDWIDHELVLAQLDAAGERRCSRRSAIVSEDGTRLARLHIRYEMGDGVCLWPAGVLEKLRYRPAEEDRARALDASVMKHVTAALGRPPRLSYVDLHPLQIVDFKSSSKQLNGYASCLTYLDGDELDPWEALAEVYPTEAIDAARQLYPALALQAA